MKFPIRGTCGPNSRLCTTAPTAPALVALASHEAGRRIFKETYMSRSIASPLIALAAIIGAVSLGACNTVEGVGEDVTATGQAIEETAEETNDGNPRTP
jgi:predicted small secreted protein